MDTLIAALRSRFPTLSLLEQEPLSRHTTFRIGGTALVMVLAEGAQMPELRRFLYEKGVEALILGNGSNVLAPDEGWPGLVLKLISGKITVEGQRITADAGCAISRVAYAAAKQGMSGLEYAQGIPGTVGGAIFMNAGAYGGDMAHSAASSTFCDETGRTETLVGDAQSFRNRASHYSDHPGTIITEACFALTPDDPAAIAARMEDYAARRAASQPLTMPSAGSVFKRPEGYFAGKLIQDCGLKGYTVGGAQVSEKHAGFIVNTGSATAEDVRRLIAHIQKTVFERFGVHLEPEVRILRP